MRLLFVPLAAAIFAFGLVTAATELIGDEPIATSQATGIVWADRVFPTKHDFEGWLKSRGASYEAWSARHPAAARAFEPVGASGTAAGPAQTQDHSTLAVGLVIVSVLGLLALLSALRLRSPRPAYARRSRYGTRPTRPDLRRPATGRVAIERLLVSSVSSARGAGTVLRRRIADRRPSGEGADAVEYEPQPVRTKAPARKRRNPLVVLRQLAPHRALSARPVAKSLAASRGAWGEIAERVVVRRGRHGEYSAQYETIFSHEVIRRYAPEIAWCVTSILLAVAVGASIAIYLN